MVSTEGRPIKKPWRFITSDEQQALALQVFKCPHHPSEHQEAAGKETKLTEIYLLALATAILESLFPHSVRVPALGCDPVLPPEHISKETQATGFVPSPFMWSEIFSINARRRGTKNLERCELLESVHDVTSRPTTECQERRHNIAVTKSLSREEISSCPEFKRRYARKQKDS